jgi:hypothetical protein
MVDTLPTGDANFDGVDPFYASDCTDAATQAANGRCTARLDCCVQTPSDCVCGDPTLTDLGSCADIATARGGTIVDICPFYTRASP